MSKHAASSVPRFNLRKTVSVLVVTAGVASGFAFLQSELDVSPSEASPAQPAEVGQYR